MKMRNNQKWLIIPDYSNLSGSAELAENYNAGFEYNDFCIPAVYSSAEETNRRISAYKALDRDRSGDTMHGVFLDIAPASADDTIRTYCRSRMEQSAEIALQLGIRGVVFHTGLIGQLSSEYYINSNLDGLEETFRTLCGKFSTLDFYLENTFEKTPDFFLKLKDRMADVKNFLLCLDYAHASINETPAEDWIKALSSFIGHIHLNDNDLVNDLHLTPSEGKIDFMHFRRLMKQNGIQLPILLELDGIEKQKKALEYMTEIYEKECEV